jgi:hypothetical protein
VPPATSTAPGQWLGSTIEHVAGPPPLATPPATNDHDG